MFMLLFPDCWSLPQSGSSEESKAGWNCWRRGWRVLLKKRKVQVFELCVKHLYALPIFGRCYLSIKTGAKCYRFRIHDFRCEIVTFVLRLSYDTWTFYCHTGKSARILRRALALPSEKAPFTDWLPVIKERMLNKMSFGNFKPQTIEKELEHFISFEEDGKQHGVKPGKVMDESFFEEALHHQPSLH